MVRNPQTVATFVKAFVEGAQGAGALSTAKHFPGHGDTATDSHIGLPVVDVDRGRLESIELVPFRAAIGAGVGSVMSAHIALPKIEGQAAPPVRAFTDKERELAEFVSLTESESQNVTMPGTLSAKVMTGLLRKDLGFNGIITTDAMSMAGVAARFDPGQAAVLAIQAGADVVLKSPDVDASVLAIRKAVASGGISAPRLDASVRRIIEAKARLGLHLRRQVSISELDRVVSSPESLRVAQEIADRSITLVKDEKRLLPLDSAGQNRILHVTITDDEDRNVMTPLLNELRKRSLNVDQVVIDAKQNAAAVEERVPRDKIERASVILVSVAVRARSGKGTVALPGGGDRVLELLKASGRPVVAITFGNPYLLKEFEGIGTCLAAYSIVAVSQRAAGACCYRRDRDQREAASQHSRVVYARSWSAGRATKMSAIKFANILCLLFLFSYFQLPVADPESVGMSAARLARIDEAVANEIGKKQLPGAVVVVGRQGRIVWRQAYGHRALEPAPETITADTIYDLASLTKVVATATSVMILVERGQVRLGDPVFRYIPEFGAAGKKTITVEQLLTHRSGLIADNDIKDYEQGPEKAIRKHLESCSRCGNGNAIHLL